MNKSKIDYVFDYLNNNDFRYHMEDGTPYKELSMEERDILSTYIIELQQENKKQKEVIDKAKSLNHEISHTIYEDFLEENIIGSNFLYERIKKQLSILEDKEVSE